MPDPQRPSRHPCDHCLASVGMWHSISLDARVAELEAELTELRELHDGTLHVWADEREHLAGRIVELEAGGREGELFAHIERLKARIVERQTRVAHWEGLAYRRARSIEQLEVRIAELEARNEELVEDNAVTELRTYIEHLEALEQVPDWEWNCLSREQMVIALYRQKARIRELEGWQ
jgi:hypothetical protein